MRADRLLALLMLLRRRGRMTASAIAAELEVSVRTVLRDIEALSLTGVPIYAERGRAGGFALLEGFSTDLTGLTHDEAAALFTAGARGPASASDQLGLAPALTSALAKLVAAMPQDQRRTAERVAHRLLVDAEGFVSRGDAGEREHLETVHQAVFTDRRLWIEYRSATAGAATTRTIDPLGLVHSAGHWYLVALHRGAQRIYRVSRIGAARILEQPAHRPHGLDLAEVWTRRRAEFRRRLTGVTATVAIDPRRVPDVVGAAAGHEDAAAAAPPSQPGWPVLQLSFTDTAHAQGVLWSFAADLEVLAPQPLREYLAHRAAVVADRHG